MNEKLMGSIEHFGIARHRAQNYHADSQGIQLSFQTVSDATIAFRQCSIPEDWQEEIDKDYRGRGKKR